MERTSEQIVSDKKEPVTPQTEERKSSTNTLCELTSRTASATTLRKNSADTASDVSRRSDGSSESASAADRKRSRDHSVGALESLPEMRTSAISSTHTGRATETMKYFCNTVATNTDVTWFQGSSLCCFCRVGNCNDVSTSSAHNDRVSPYKYCDSQFTSIDASRQKIPCIKNAVKYAPTDVSAVQLDANMLISNDTSGVQATNIGNILCNLEASTLSSMSRATVPYACNVATSALSAQAQVPSFKSSKTSTDLASLALVDCYEDLHVPEIVQDPSANVNLSVETNASSESYQKFSNKKFSTGESVDTLKALTGLNCTSFQSVFQSQTARRLYPNLSDMDDHRAVFGPPQLQPDVIATKVQALVRVAPEKGRPNLQLMGESPAPEEVYSRPECETVMRSVPVCSVLEGTVESAGDNKMVETTQWKTFYSDRFVKVQNIHESLQRTPNPLFLRSESKSESNIVEKCNLLVKPVTDETKKVIFIIGEDDELDEVPSSSYFRDDDRPPCLIECAQQPIDTRAPITTLHVSRAKELRLHYINLLAESMDGCTGQKTLSAIKSGHKRASSDPLARRSSRSATSSVLVQHLIKHSDRSHAGASQFQSIDKAVQTVDKFTEFELAGNNIEILPTPW